MIKIIEIFSRRRYFGCGFMSLLYEDPRGVQSRGSSVLWLNRR